MKLKKNQIIALAAVAAVFVAATVLAVVMSAIFVRGEGSFTEGWGTDPAAYRPEENVTLSEDETAADAKRFADFSAQNLTPIEFDMRIEGRNIAEAAFADPIFPRALEQKEFLIDLKFQDGFVLDENGEILLDKESGNPVPNYIKTTPNYLVINEEGQHIEKIEIYALSNARYIRLETRNYVGENGIFKLKGKCPLTGTIRIVISRSRGTPSFSYISVY